MGPRYYRGKYPADLYRITGNRIECIVCGANADLVSDEIGKLFENCEARGCKDKERPSSYSDRLRLHEKWAEQDRKKKLLGD